MCYSCDRASTLFTSIQINRLVVNSLRFAEGYVGCVSTSSVQYFYEHCYEQVVVLWALN